MSKTVLKICCNEWKNASRDKRELSVCRELGLQTLVMAKGETKDKYKKDYVDGFDVLRFSTRPLGSSVPNGINRVISLLLWSKYARKLQPDIISGHDIGGLAIGYLSNIFRSHKAKLVYDSHEFEIGRNANRNKLQLWWVTHLERFLIKHCVFSIMVNDGIADEVQCIHKLTKRPVVVRSTPNLCSVDPVICLQKREELLSDIESPTNFLVMYHGVVMEGRGIEALLELVKNNQAISATILGNGETEYIDSLKKQAENMGIVKRISFHSAVSIEKLWQYVGAADVGMILAPAISRNHLFSLPNKFFENIQSETPIICPCYPAMKLIVERYKIGLTCDPLEIDDINSCVEKMRTDKIFYSQCKEGIKKAKQELCWENEKLVLKNAYLSLLE